jgi:hypothetical protein
MVSARPLFLGPDWEWISVLVEMLYISSKYLQFFDLTFKVSCKPSNFVFEVYYCRKRILCVTSFLPGTCFHPNTPAGRLDEEKNTSCKHSPVRVQIQQVGIKIHTKISSINNSPEQNIRGWTQKC